jgi:hypothetical protein
MQNKGGGCGCGGNGNNGGKNYNLLNFTVTGLVKPTPQDSYVKPYTAINFIGK